ncbi:hypothetical protein E8E13_001328 [Curvularia kusanoi]|uniref:Uncharacterized protein n=1 Tax=Curvularia kusanoi TaxID=90978 RepID=A0A9P4T5K5_CURKU|nr:hypothetical protein E8E13_001328 [Curvularia kusanoi]
MNERWKDDLLSKLETHVEILADETLRFITNGLAAERVGSGGQDNENSDAPDNRYSVSADRLFAHTTQTNTYGESSGNISNLTENDQTIGWEPLGVFSEFLGTDFIDPYWDMQGIDDAFASTFQT